MLVDHRLAPAFRKNFTSICLYSWVERGAGRRYCFVKNASRLSGENFDPEFSVLAVILSRLPEFFLNRCKPFLEHMVLFAGFQPKTVISLKFLTPSVRFPTNTPCSRRRKDLNDTGQQRLKRSWRS